MTISIYTSLVIYWPSATDAPRPVVSSASRIRSRSIPAADCNTPSGFNPPPPPRRLLSEAASCTACTAVSSVAELPNNMRANISSCGKVGVEAKLIWGLLPVPEMFTRTLVPSTVLPAETRSDGLVAAPLKASRPSSISNDRPAKSSVPRTRFISPAIRGASVVPVTRKSALHLESRPMPVTCKSSLAIRRTSSFQLLGSDLMGSASPETRSLDGVLRRMPVNVVIWAAPCRTILYRVSGSRNVPLIKASPSGVLVTLIVPVAAAATVSLRAMRACFKSRLSWTGKPFAELKLIKPCPVIVPCPARALSSVTFSWSLVNCPRTRNWVSRVP